MDAEGRWVAQALATAPLLVTIRAGRVQLEDGYHRLGVACHLFRELEVPVLCAEVPGLPVNGPQGHEKPL